MNHNRYFVTEGVTRNVMAKKTSHLWIINSEIVKEYLSFCASNGEMAYDPKEIHGRQVDWREGGLGNGARQAKVAKLNEKTEKKQAHKHDKHQ